jgi:hypothetical protein
MMATDFTWFELFPPRSLTVEMVTAFLRPFASRARVGFFAKTPRVVIEQWQTGSKRRILIGLESPLDETALAHTAAVVPGSVLRAVTTTRPEIHLASEMRLRQQAGSIRTEVAFSVSAQVGAALNATPDDASVVLQWILGVAEGRSSPPEEFDIAKALGFKVSVKTSAREDSTWRAKASEPLFAVTGRIGTTGNGSLVKPLRAALQVVDSAAGRLVFLPPTTRAAANLASAIMGRSSGILSAKELAVVLAWPLGGTDHVSPLPIGDIPPTLSGHKGRLLGVSTHPATDDLLVYLPETSLSRHTHVIGPTGSGKSVLLQRMALDDVRAGRALVLAEPKGDLCDLILDGLTPETLGGRRLIVIDAGEVDRPIGFDPLSGDAESRERRVDELMSLFRAVFGSGVGPRSSDVLLHGLLLAARSPGGTLADVPIILTNDAYRQRIAAGIDDPLVLEPWLAGYNAMSDGERAQVVSPVLNKLRAFLSRSSIRRMLGQSGQTWSWDDVFARGDVVLISLNRGKLGNEAAHLMGSLLFSSLWSAVMRRTLLPEHRRPLGSVIVDELPLFIGALDFEEVLATARGMGVSFTAAHQQLAQLSPSLRSALFSNARSRVMFAPAEEDRKALAAVLHSANLTTEDFARLRPYEAVASVYGYPGAFHIRTFDTDPSTGQGAALRDRSRQKFGADGATVDSQLLERWNVGGFVDPVEVGRTPRRRQR